MESRYYMRWYYKALNKMSRRGFMNSACVLEEFFILPKNLPGVPVSSFSDVQRGQSIFIFEFLVYEDVK